MTTTALAFDSWQFEGQRQHPVYANFIAGERQSSGLSFEDYARCNAHNRKPSAERRLPTPPGALDNLLLKTLFVVYLENRAGIRYKREGTLAERLAYAVAKIQAEVPFKVETVKALNHEFVARQAN